MIMQAKRAQTQLDLLHDGDVRKAISEGILDNRKSMLKDAINQMKQRKLDLILALANPTKLAIHKTSQSAIEAGVIHFDQRLKLSNEFLQIIKPILKKAEMKIEQESEEYKQEQIYQKIINDHKKRVINRGKNRQIKNEILQNNLEMSHLSEEKSQIIPTIKESIQDSISKNEILQQKSPEKTITAQSQSVQQQKLKQQSTSKVSQLQAKTQPQPKLPFGVIKSSPFEVLLKPKEVNLNSLFGVSKPNEANSLFTIKDKQASTNLFTVSHSSGSLFGLLKKETTINLFAEPNGNQVNLFSTSRIPSQKKETSIFSLNATNMKESPTPEKPQQTPIINIFGQAIAKNTSNSLLTFGQFGMSKVSQKSDAQAKSIFEINQDKGTSIFNLKPANTTSNLQNTKQSNVPFNLSPTPNFFNKIEGVQKSEAQVKPKEGNMLGLLNKPKEASLFTSVSKGKEGSNFQKPNNNSIPLSVQKDDAAPPNTFSFLTGQKANNLFTSKDEVNSSLKFEGSSNKKQ